MAKKKTPARKPRTRKRSKAPTAEQLNLALGLGGHRASSRANIAMDYFRNLAARMGYGTPSLAEATEYDMVRLSNDYWLMLTLYRNHWLARRIVDVPAIDMTRRWANLTSEISPDDIALFDQAIQRTYTPQRVTQGLKWGRLYGGAGALMVIDGHERYLEEPLDYDDVEPGSYRGLITFDRWTGIQPAQGLSTDFDRPEDFGLPEYYDVSLNQEGGQTFRVHSSRILRFCGPEVPTPEFQAQVYWGISVLELVWEELRKRDNASWAILQLLFRANLVAQVNPQLAQLLSGVGISQTALQQFAARMQAQNELLSNQSMLVLPEDGSFQSVQYSFAGISEVLQQFQMDVAGASKTTVTRLFGRTITGLGQSNDQDERMYETWVHEDQESDLRPQLNKLYPVICMSLFGEVPKDLNFEFPSVRILTEEEKAEMADKGSAPVIAAFNAGVISHKTTLKELKQLGETTGLFTNITEEDIEKASDEPQPMGELGGEGFEHMNPEREERKLSQGAADAASIPKRVKWHGMDVSIETPAGSIRKGSNGAGPWQVRMAHDYGYLRNTEGVDGDHVDVFLGSHPEARDVYVVHTRKAPDFTETDEDKCFLNFPSASAAREAFLKNFDRPEHFGEMETLSVDEFIRKAKATRTDPVLITH